METFVNLEIELTVTKGRGYVPGDESKDKGVVIGTIPVDAIYTPIKGLLSGVKYQVGQKPTMKNLILR